VFKTGIKKLRTRRRKLWNGWQKHLTTHPWRAEYRPKFAKRKLRHRWSVSGNKIFYGSEDIMNDDIFCCNCIYLKYDKWVYCSKSGIIISGTLERQDKCKKENWKEIKDA